ncbi:hypothetical protein TIFTF001_002713 [Ficus carica]|uniref:Fungal lipase-type domain-containing protein n=1 Tax=Ficus carica TaxID=3494 RepID=A0AA87ZP56_FICCA|nr:hypothetical protein TIFTF001_002713 [Ficus carica]
MSTNSTAACEEGFSCSFMLMKPQDVSFFNLLIYILFSNIFEDRRRVNSSRVSDESFGYRRLVIVSILLQKFLLRLAKPMDCLGSSIEFGLNLWSSNDGSLSSLIHNTIHGKLVIPDKTSQNFSSIIGNVDKRQNLDSNIKPGDPRYNAALSMMASKLSYENKAHIEYTVTQLWKMEFLGFFEYWNDFQEKATTQAFMMRDKGDDHDTIVVAFRGTLPFDVAAWCSDVDISWYRIPKVGKVHGGFLKALGLQKSAGLPRDMIEEDIESKRPLPLAYYDIREKLRDLLRQNDKAKYVVTGHSLGGALAILFRAVLTLHEEKFLLERLEGVYTFGQPRVGDEKFGEFMKKEITENDIRYFRFVYCNDVVPRLPYDHKPLKFKHFGTCLHSDRNYRVKVHIFSILSLFINTKV